MLANWRAAGRTSWTNTIRSNTTWDILPAGLVIAVPGGLVFGWAHIEIKAGLRRRPWAALAVFTLVAATLTPAIVLGQFNPLLGLVNVVASPPVAIATIVVELLLTETVVGGLAGWRLGHTRRAALATALASLNFAVGPGHDIPLLGSTPAVGKGIALLVAIAGVAAVVLVESQAWLTRQPRLMRRTEG